MERNEAAADVVVDANADDGHCLKEGFYLLII